MNKKLKKETSNEYNFEDENELNNLGYQLLKDNRMVKARREGKTVFYRLDDQHVFDILEETLEHTRH